MKKLLKNMIVFIFGAGAGVAATKIIKKKRIEDTVVSTNRFETGFNLFNKWLKLKNEGKTLIQYFTDNEIKTVAIYGMGAIGERLFQELSIIGIKVIYAIDRIANSKNIEGLKIIGLEDEYQEVDLIVVTPIQDFYDIEEMLEVKTDADIVSLEDVIDYCS